MKALDEPDRAVRREVGRAREAKPETLAVIRLGADRWLTSSDGNWRVKVGPEFVLELNDALRALYEADRARAEAPFDIGPLSGP